jgi:two-component system nitrate/nitrite response regulator NarL
MILLVEDHDQVRTSLRNWLGVTFPGYGFLEATSGEEAVTMSREHHPVLVLMDVALPKMNGIEATRQIKTEHPDTQVVILTIHDEDEYRREAESAGANAFLGKERAYSTLVPVMQRLLDASAPPREETLQ